MSMSRWFISRNSSHCFIIIISHRILSDHTSIKSHHQLLIFLWRVITCPIFPHHICYYSGFRYPKMLYMFISIPVS